MICEHKAFLQAAPDFLFILKQKKKFPNKAYRFSLIVNFLVCLKTHKLKEINAHLYAF